MNRLGLVVAASAKTGIGRRQVDEVLDSVLVAMAESVARGESVRLAGYLRLEVQADAKGRTAVRATLGPKLGGSRDSEQ